MVIKLAKFILLSALLSSCALKTVSQNRNGVPVKTSPGFNEDDFKDFNPQNNSSATSNGETNSSAVSSPQAPPVDATAVLVTPTLPTSTVTSQNVPRIGLILIGGGAKAWAHIGVLKEIEKAKWPISGIAGLEWGAAVAATYAHQLSSNEAEWEMSKVKSLNNVELESSTLFNNKSVADLKIPFVCASLNIAKQQVYLLNRGQLAQLLPFCLPYPPLSTAYKQSVASMSSIGLLAQHLRATGIKKVILINILAQNDKRSFVGDYLSAENILWSEAAAAADNKPPGVDDVIQINLDNFGIKDLDKRREIIARGAELSYSQIKKLSEKYGL